MGDCEMCDGTGECPECDDEFNDECDICGGNGVCPECGGIG